MTDSKSQRENRSPETLARAYIKRQGTTGVEQLYEQLRISNPTIQAKEVAALVELLRRDGTIDLVEKKPSTESLRQYLGMWDENLWLYTSAAVSLIALLVILAIPTSSPYVPIRWVLGTSFVLFMPGYVTVQALFPSRAELDGFKRFALSIGLSLVLVMLFGLLLNESPWGITLATILVSLTSLTIVLDFVALGRRFAGSVNQLRTEGSDRT